MTEDQLVEIAAKAIAVTNEGGINGEHLWRYEKDAAAAVIAAIRPHIEAAERERCARIAEDFNIGGIQMSYFQHHIAAAIRAEPKEGNP